MTLNQIRAFVAVVQHGGLTAAARALHMQHSTISSQIQALEQEYGAELFQRRGRRIELSALGLELLPLARGMVAIESDIGRLLDDGGSLRRGTLKIGAVSPYHVTEMIEAYHDMYPAIGLSVMQGNSEYVLANLDNYVCDVGVLASRHAGSRYYMRSYARYPVIAFVHVDHPFARRASVSLQELAREPMLVRERGSTTRKALEDAMQAHGLTPRVMMEIGSREALRETVARGIGIGTVSQSEYVPDPRLRPVEIEGNEVFTHIHVCCLRERRESRLIASFFEAVDRCVSRLETGPGTSALGAEGGQP
ncbi:LysR substrate-binding domain-containing protein [Bordetella sp. LUAb4]|uniref:LysR substrate-binding domain-containing protein n=1 Tax=Bordetella sp. LUAb4 TaxID=2843195 RepID=UPI001E51DE42